MEINKETIQQAKNELEEVCKKYNIALVPVVVHQGDRTFSSIEITPLSQELSDEAPKSE